MVCFAGGIWRPVVSCATVSCPGRRCSLIRWQYHPTAKCWPWPVSITWRRHSGIWRVWASPESSWETSGVSGILPSRGTGEWSRPRLWRAFLGISPRPGPSIATRIASGDRSASGTFRRGPSRVALRWSTVIPGVSRSRRTARFSPRAFLMRRSGSTTRPPATKSLGSRSTAPCRASWRFRRTGGSWPRVLVRTGPREACPRASTSGTSCRGKRFVASPRTIRV